MSEKRSAVNHPSHYNAGSIEVIDAIEDWNLGFNLGNTVKYIAREAYKGNPLEDIKKARWYLDREINRREKAMAKHARLNKKATKTSRR